MYSWQSVSLSFSSLARFGDLHGFSLSSLSLSCVSRLAGALLEWCLGAGKGGEEDAGMTRTSSEMKRGECLLE